MDSKTEKIRITSSKLNTREKRELLLLAEHAAKLVGVKFELIESITVSVRNEVARGKPWAGMTETEDMKNFHVNIRYGRYRTLNDRCQLLLHEMTHVRQYTEGDLVILPSGEEYWKGTLIEDGMIEHVLENGTDEEYESLPWEKEPYKNEMRFLEDMLRFALTMNYAHKITSEDEHEAFLNALGSPYSGLL